MAAYARGSEWHRWDPHLHAPGTLLNDQFGGDWEAYLSRIEGSTPRIEALGVTDYFCIQTYRAVKARKVAGRLAGGGLPEISYQTGSLENNDIRGLVCQTLEGGERAFLERERRYRLRWGHSLLEEPDTTATV